MNYLLYIFYFLFSVGGATIFKLGSSKMTVTLKNGVITGSLGIVPAIGLGCYLLSFLLWMLILKNNNMSSIAPILSGVGAVLMVISGIVIFGESLSIYKIAGICLVIVGVFLMNLK